jgi:hypothetical protein
VCGNPSRAATRCHHAAGSLSRNSAVQASTSPRHHADAPIRRHDSTAIVGPPDSFPGPSVRRARRPSTRWLPPPRSPGRPRARRPASPAAERTIVAPRRARMAESYRWVCKPRSGDFESICARFCACPLRSWSRESLLTSTRAISAIRPVESRTADTAMSTDSRGRLVACRAEQTGPDDAVVAGLLTARQAAVDHARLVEPASGARLRMRSTVTDGAAPLWPGGAWRAPVAGTVRSRCRRARPSGCGRSRRAVR